MATDLVVPPFDLDSPFFRAVLNDRWTSLAGISGRRRRLPPTSRGMCAG
ncbi:MAG: hypothetical protein H0U84_10025 [Thermoleophilaceae bacterium]|nr:hypothetical protein [Thermoleophilaceae bacterium]